MNDEMRPGFTPEGIEDLLPPQAEKLEFYRRELLDLFAASGFEYVKPPLAEFIETLLIGAGQDLAADTCWFTDQESGRQMGIRADMTPQIARIAAALCLHRDETVRTAPLRLSYAGDVLRARWNRASGSRSPYQVGAELFNVPGIAGDQEILLLMMEAMEALGLAPVLLSLGHAGLIRAVLEESGLDESARNRLLTLMYHKARPEYADWLAQHLDQIPLGLQAFFTDWFLLAGEARQVVDQGRVLLEQYPHLVQQLDEVAQLLDMLTGMLPQVRVFADLADVRGYQYHTGVLFSTYVQHEDHSIRVARGGRYDGITAPFGSPLAATGFSLDLRAVLSQLPPIERVGERIWAPLVADTALYERVQQLRSEGWEVIWCASVPEGAERALHLEQGEWIIRHG